jgi:hypothetical protein
MSTADNFRVAAESSSPDARSFDPNQLTNQLRQLLKNGRGVVEIRIFGADIVRGFIIPADQWPKTILGWFDNTASAVTELRRVRGASVYVTVNPVNRDFLSRISNRLKISKSASKDEDVVCLCWLFIDVDAVRIKDVSSTDQELTKAIAKRDQILADHPEIREAAIWGCSGNGGWIIASLPQYPNDEEHRQLVADALDSLGSKYTDKFATIDSTTKNPSRVMPAAGTIKCKGDNGAERPHRMVTIDGGNPDREPMDLRAWLERNPKPLPEPQPARTQAPSTPFSFTARSGGRPSAEDRARACVFKTKYRAVQGSKGSKTLMAVLKAIRNGFGCERDALERIGGDWNAQFSDPPFSEKEMQHAIDNTMKKYPNPSLNLFNKEPKDNGYRRVGPSPSIERADALGDAALEGILGIIRAGNPDEIYRSPATLMLIARLADCRPGEYKIIKDTFRERTKDDKRWSVGDLDEAMRRFKKEALRLNEETLKDKRREARSSAATAQKPQAPTETPSNPEPPVDPDAEPTPEDIKRWECEHEEAEAKKAEDREFANWTWEESEDKDGNPKQIQRPLSVRTLDFLLSQFLGQWPKRVGKTLFVPDQKHTEPVYLDSMDQFFATIDRMAMVDWMEGPVFLSKARYYQHKRLTAEPFNSIENMPHVPPIPGIYYMHQALPKPSGKLDKFVDFFCPSTPEDRELIKAFVMTALWGGAPGDRPAFLITGPDNDLQRGRGLGKTTLLDVVSNTLYGGSIDVSPNDDMGDVKTRILSTDASLKRIMRLDNVKTLRLSWGELENFITAKVISGKALYRGEGQRPNTLVVVITLNGACVSKDMAQRVVVIKLGRPDFRAEWSKEVSDFATEHRWEILAEIAEILGREPGGLPPRSRWSTWQRDVLSKVDLAENCQALIQSRQGTIDEDDSGRDVVLEFFRKQFNHMNIDPDYNMIFLSSQIAAEWLSTALREPYKTNAATSYLKNVGILELSHDRTAESRGWNWAGKDFNGVDSDRMEVKVDGVGRWAITPGKGNTRYKDTPPGPCKPQPVAF